MKKTYTSSEISSVLIIANPLVAIRPKLRSELDVITKHLERNGCSVDTTYSMRRGIGKKHASRASLEGYDLVLGAGGDGTINDIAAGLLGKDIPFGIIPMGTGNGFARGLGIPLDTEGLLAILDDMHTVDIDVGMISGNVFVSTAGLGYDAAIAHDFNKRTPEKRSINGYFMTALKKYFSRAAEYISLSVDGGKPEEKRIFALSISNTPQYGGGAVISPQAEPTTGSLVAVVIPKFGILKALPAIYKLFTGKANTLKELEYIEFRNMKIKRRKAGYYHVDGETLEGKGTLLVKVKPGAIRVIVPKQ